MSTDEHVQHCPACGRDQRSERPPCEDGHGAAAASVPVTATAVLPAGTGARAAA
ncbi:hypothetical protein [Parafrankia elaeagni]|uniref:hypothetical protein n=1 Tax=Parafrankia elaeagni TaxID=222534 RepID=UPI0012B55D86|nr:hypothetical protein [Parafrankia elaeagni]